MTIMLLLRQGFSKLIGNIVISGDLFYLYVILLYDLPDQMITPKHMLGSLARSRFLCLYDSPIVVTIQDDWTNNAQNHSKFGDKLHDPNCLLGCIRCSDVLSLSHRIYNHLLLGTLSANCITIECNMYPD